MVRIGITDAWGSEVRTALGASLSNRFKGFFHRPWCYRFITKQQCDCIIDSLV